MLKVVDGGKALLYQVANEVKKEVSNRRKNGEKEWDTLEYVIKRADSFEQAHSSFSPYTIGLKEERPPSNNL